jgi:hypothetical protein
LKSRRTGHEGGAERAAYGDALVERLAKDLTQHFGRGFSRQNLWQMREALQKFVRESFSALMSRSDLENYLPGLLTDENRTGIVLSRLRAMAAHQHRQSSSTIGPA